MKSTVLLIMYLLLLSACASIRLTPEQTLVWGTKVYIQQYYSYIDAVVSLEYNAEERQAFKDNPKLLENAKINADLTEEELKMLRANREILIELRPIIDLAKVHNLSGTLPPKETQEVLIRLINKLLEGSL
jgi:hypothetical protein